ncbi:MAG: DUF2797 domain-containing protein [Candidatus Micrarchaeota archaeon]
MEKKNGHYIYFSSLNSKLQFWESEGARYGSDKNSDIVILEAHGCKRTGESLVTELELKGTLNLKFYGKRQCIGYNDCDGKHRCPMRIIDYKQCAACAAKDISRLYTRLDYMGFEKFFASFRNQEFSVYLASFGHLVKCGVTRSSRLMNRVREQGADYFVEIAKTENAETAYSLEFRIKQNYSLRNGITSIQKMKLISTEENPSRIRNYANKISESDLLGNYACALKIQKLDYIIPKSFSEAENINGTICGNKGQILFFENEDKNGAVCYGINMANKIGMKFDYSLIGS